MPTPKADDPLRCPGSDNADLVKDWELRTGRHDRLDTWWICPACKRALKRCAGPHRVRSRTTWSLDQTRDILANITLAEIASATATDPSRSTT